MGEICMSSNPTRADDHYNKNHTTARNHKYICSAFSSPKYGILLIFILITALIGCGDDDSNQELNVIKAKVGQLEERINVLKEQNSQLEHIEAKLYDMEKTLDTTKGLIQSLDKEQMELTRTVRELAKKTASSRNKPQSTAASKVSSTTKQKNRYHTVKSGDTLYKIAKNNGLSVNELRRINKLNNNAVIHPGQKLIVRKGSQR